MHESYPAGAGYRSPSISTGTKMRAFKRPSMGEGWIGVQLLRILVPRAAN